jgi:hypothetical protein
MPVPNPQMPEIIENTVCNVRSNPKQHITICNHGEQKTMFIIKTSHPKVFYIFGAADWKEEPQNQ